MAAAAQVGQDGGMGMRFGVYRTLFGTPQVSRLVPAAMIGRAPVGMMGLALVLLVRQAGESYATAGLVVAAYAVSAGVTAPLVGRLIDRVGQTRVLLACAVGCLGAFVALAGAAATVRGAGWCLAAAAGAVHAGAVVDPARAGPGAADGVLAGGGGAGGEFRPRAAAGGRARHRCLSGGRDAGDRPARLRRHDLVRDQPGVAGLAWAQQP